MCLNNIYELGSKLCELLSTLKKNREYVPLEILQTQYRVPYETLKKQIGDTATAFVKEITLSKLMINPDVSLEEQISVIQQTITTSGILKEMGYTLSKLYDVELLHRQALKLRTYIEDALYPYIALAYQCKGRGYTGQEDLSGQCAASKMCDSCPSLLRMV